MQRTVGAATADEKTVGRMAKPNYQFEKRQRDLRKKQKQEAKRQRKADTKAPAIGGETTNVEAPQSTTKPS